MPSILNMFNKVSGVTALSAGTFIGTQIGRVYAPVVCSQAARAAASYAVPYGSVAWNVGVRTPFISHATGLGYNLGATYGVGLCGVAGGAIGVAASIAVPMAANFVINKSYDHYTKMCKAAETIAAYKNFSEADYVEGTNEPYTLGEFQELGQLEDLKKLGYLKKEATLQPEDMDCVYVIADTATTEDQAENIVSDSIRGNRKYPSMRP